MSRLANQFLEEDEETKETESYNYEDEWPRDEFGNVDGWELFKQDELASEKD